MMLELWAGSMPIFLMINGMDAPERPAKIKFTSMYVYGC
jgi:hypothetical protein